MPPSLSITTRDVEDSELVVLKSSTGLELEDSARVVLISSTRPDVEDVRMVVLALSTASDVGDPELVVLIVALLNLKAAPGLSRRIRRGSPLDHSLLRLSAPAKWRRASTNAGSWTPTSLWRLDVGSCLLLPTRGFAVCAPTTASRVSK